MKDQRSANERITERGNFKELYRKNFGDVISRTKSMTPEQLFDMGVAYFEWAEANQIKAAETASFQGEVSESLIHKVRVFTLNGFALFAGLTLNTLARYRSEPGYSEVMEFIDSVVYEQKFQLAANGIVNPGFIGKDLGIDKPANITVETVASANSNAVGTVEQQMEKAVENVLDNL